MNASTLGGAVATYLDRIIASHRAAAAVRWAGADLDQLRSRAAATGGVREFARALQGHGDGLAVIAEVKRRSPSKGDLDPDLDPAVAAKAYEAAGAACVSVLTDEEFFGGAPHFLAAARQACSLPVLRKDFTVCEGDVLEARLLGADAVLLIVAALSDAELRAFAALAGDVGLDALVEVHDEAELERALGAGASLVGVNQRDLTTFTVDTARAVRVARAIPDGVVRVAESGIRDGDDARRLRDAGYHAVLVGEALVTSPDMAATLRELSCS